MFLLYLCANENIGLLDTPCEEKNIIVKQMNGVFSFSAFVTNDVSNLNCCQYLVLDLSALTDTDDDLINALVGIKSIYEFRIIILAIGYEDKSTILGRLFSEGIYNIITTNRLSAQLDEIRLCLGAGIKYKDAIRFRIQSNIPLTNQKVIIQKPSIRQTISVGFCGTLPRIGTTKQALHMTKFLTESGYTACYIEDNNHKHMETLKDFYHVDVLDDTHIAYGGIDIYTKHDMVKILERRYDFLIFDSGLFENINFSQFLTRDIKIICAGSSPWEAPYLSPIFKALGDYIDVYFIFSFASNEMKKAVRNLMGKFSKRCLFAEPAPDFSYGVTNHGLFKEILKPYIQDNQRSLLERIRRK